MRDWHHGDFSLVCGYSRLLLREGGTLDWPGRPPRLGEPREPAEAVVTWPHRPWRCPATPAIAMSSGPPPGAVACPLTLVFSGQSPELSSLGRCQWMAWHGPTGVEVLTCLRGVHPLVLLGNAIATDLPTIEIPAQARRCCSWDGSGRLVTGSPRSGRMASLQTRRQRSSRCSPGTAGSITSNSSPRTRSDRGTSSSLRTGIPTM
jgi:hypothetical protein